MQGTCEYIKWHMQTLRVNTCNTIKENAHAQVSRTLPLRHGCVYSHPASTQIITCMPIFIVRSLQP